MLVGKLIHRFQTGPPPADSSKLEVFVKGDQFWVVDQPDERVKVCVTQLVVANGEYQTVACNETN